MPDAYHSARTSLKRAFSHVVGPWLRADEVRHTKAFARLMERRAAQGVETEPRWVLPGWSTLAKGDGNAVCFMTVAHANLLRSQGAYADESIVSYARHFPEPADQTYQGIIVDDFNTIAIVPDGRAVRGQRGEAQRCGVPRER